MIKYRLVKDNDRYYVEKKLGLFSKWYPQWGIKQAIEKIVEWEKAVQSGTSAAEITDKQIKEYFNA